MEFLWRGHSHRLPSHEEETKNEKYGFLAPGRKPSLLAHKFSWGSGGTPKTFGTDSRTRGFTGRSLKLVLVTVFTDISPALEPDQKPSEGAYRPSRSAASSISVGPSLRDQ